MSLGHWHEQSQQNYERFNGDALGKHGREAVQQEIGDLEHCWDVPCFC
jgi:hypothetical protein